MELNIVKEAFDRVTKKQKLSRSKAQEVIDQIDQEIEDVLQKLQSGNELNVLNDLKVKLKDSGLLTQMEATQRELNVALSKYTKLVEKTFNPDIAKAYRNTEFDSHALNQIIADHLYRQGLFGAGDCFAAETRDTKLDCETKPTFEEMYRILEAMKRRDLEPALSWAAENSDELRRNGSDLSLRLHGLQFIEILQSRSKEEALEYARAHLSPFAGDHMSEVQKLVACLIWAGRLDRSPYRSVLSPENWDRVAGEFSRQFCGVSGWAHESPLEVAVAAGAQALPALLKFVAVVAGKRRQREDWEAMKELPVPVEIGREFQFHSVFVCPVSKEQSTEENPAMMMKCGHVISKQSVTKMSKNGTRSSTFFFAF